MWRVQRIVKWPITPRAVNSAPIPMKFFRMLARIRYWRSRAIKAETRIIEISVQAEAERWRNVSREDTFVSAAVLGGRGMVGISPRTGPAGQPEPHRLVANPDPWQGLTWAERNEFESEWLIDAARNGISPQRAKSDFLEELSKRKKFNDEPMN